jgi:hypothetical protein
MEAPDQAEIRGIPDQFRYRGTYGHSYYPRAQRNRPRHEHRQIRQFRGPRRRFIAERRKRQRKGGILH